MASSSYTEELTCSICLAIFTDPVILLCGHSFCRKCIEGSLISQRRCPQCRADVPTEGACFLSNHILKSLAEKEAEKLKSSHVSGREVDAQLCPEHEEKLKLFCVTDQQLACIICRDGDKHDGHKFKPIKEATILVKQELEELMQQISINTTALEKSAKAQGEEITKTKTTSKQLMAQISKQFQEMQEFLRKKEIKIKSDLKQQEDDAVQKMTKTLTALETALKESKEQEEKVEAVLKITDSEKFLKSWTENESKMGPEAHDVEVVKSCLSLGPFESHLQFFVWKEMLQIIQPREERLSITSNCNNVHVSTDGRDLMYTPKINKSYNCTPCQYCRNQRSLSFFNTRSYNCREDTSIRCVAALSCDEFTSGQHYWEIEIGKRAYWKVGIENHYLVFDQQKCVTSSTQTEITLTENLQKIGVYFDCTSADLSFYDAEHMSLIHIIPKCETSAPAKAYFEYRFSKGADHNPPRVCWL